MALATAIFEFTFKPYLLPKYLVAMADHCQSKSRLAQALPLILLQVLRASSSTRDYQALSWVTFEAFKRNNWQSALF